MNRCTTPTPIIQCTVGKHLIFYVIRTGHKIIFRFNDSNLFNIFKICNTSLVIVQPLKKYRDFFFREIDFLLTKNRKFSSMKMANENKKFCLLCICCGDWFKSFTTSLASKIKWHYYFSIAKLHFKAKFSIFKNFNFSSKNIFFLSFFKKVSVLNFSDNSNFWTQFVIF